MIRQINVKDNIRSSGAGACNFPPSSGEVDISYNDSRGYTFFDHLMIRPGIKMIIANNGGEHGFHMDCEIDRAPISFAYSLFHRLRFILKKGRGKEQVLERAPGDAVLAYLPGSRGRIESPPGKGAVGLSVHFSRDSFRKLFMEIPGCLKKIFAAQSSKSPDRQFYHQSSFSTQTAFILNQIMGCPYHGEIKRLFLEAKILELVALKLAEFGEDNPRTCFELTRRDLDRVREAYQILHDRFEHPPNLNDLSRQVGLNRNRLNMGFKRLYGNTAFNILRSIRLAESCSLLLHTDLSLAEIALSVGYNSQSNFTTAFRRQFGKTPKSVRQESAVELSDCSNRIQSF